MNTGSDWEAAFERLWRCLPQTQGLPAPVREFRFDPERRWRFDFAWEKEKLAVEIHGGTTERRFRGRHNTASGIRNDAEKLRAAQAAGWMVLTYTGEDIRECPIQTIEQIVERLKQRNNLNQ